MLVKMWPENLSTHGWFSTSMLVYGRVMGNITMNVKSPIAHLVRIDFDAPQTIADSKHPGDHPLIVLFWTHLALPQSGGYPKMVVLCERENDLGFGCVWGFWFWDKLRRPVCQVSLRTVLSIPSSERPLATWCPCKGPYSAYFCGKLEWSSCSEWHNLLRIQHIGRCIMYTYIRFCIASFFLFNGFCALNWLQLLHILILIYFVTVGYTPVVYGISPYTWVIYIWPIHPLYPVVA